MKTLLPCPFCGATPEHEFWHGGGRGKNIVWCASEDCVVMPSVVGGSPGLAAEYWNQRAQPEPAPITPA